MTDRDPNEWARLRRRVDALRDRIEPRTLYGVNPAARLGKVYNGGSMPGALPGVFLMHPARPSGNEAEGATPGYVVDTSSSFAATVVGTRVPAAGDLLVARLCSGRWVAQSGSTTADDGVTLPGCACTSTPRTVTLSNNGTPDAAIPLIYPCTLQWQTTPAGLLPLSVGTECFLSTVTFPDPVTGDEYWYHLSCSLAYYQLTRVYAVSLYGSPYRELLRLRWHIGVAGTSCSPLYCVNSEIYPGANPASIWTLSA